MPPAKKRKNSASESGSKISKRDLLAKVSKELLPVAHTPYNLFYTSKLAEAKAAVEAESESELSGVRLQRAAVARVGKMWRDLGPAQQEWKDRSELEYEQRYNAAERILSGDDNMESSLDSDAERHLRMGHWRCSDTVLWQGARTAAYKATHELLESVSMAVIFRDAADYKIGLETLKRISGLGVTEKSSLFMALATGFQPESESPVHCLVYRYLPTVDECLNAGGGDRAGWSGAKLRLCAKQLAIAVNFLNTGVGVFHCDVRPKSLFWSESESILKLGRFANSRCREDSTPLEFPPYVAWYRAPELFQKLSDCKVDELTESWAYAATMVEIGSGKQLFKDLQQVINFAPASAKRFEAIQCLEVGVQNVMLKFLCDRKKRLSISSFLESNALQAQLG